MMKFADLWHTQHSSKQPCCAGQAPAWNIGHYREMAWLQFQKSKLKIETTIINFNKKLLQETWEYSQYCFKSKTKEFGFYFKFTFLRESWQILKLTLFTDVEKMTDTKD